MAHMPDRPTDLYRYRAGYAVVMVDQTKGPLRRKPEMGSLQCCGWSPNIPSSVGSADLETNEENRQVH